MADILFICCKERPYKYQTPTHKATTTTTVASSLHTLSNEGCGGHPRASTRAPTDPDKGPDARVVAMHCKGGSSERSSVTCIVEEGAQKNICLIIYSSPPTPQQTNELNAVMPHSYMHAVTIMRDLPPNLLGAYSGQHLPRSSCTAAAPVQPKRAS